MRSLVIGCILCAACTPAPSPHTRAPDAATVTIALAQQFQRAAAAWNRGDLDGFMSDYLVDTATTYIGNGGLVRGFEAIRGRYAPWFAEDANRDSLRFEDFQVRVLADELALVTARYVLYRGAERTASGPFTLIMRHRPDGWKIIHDHSSSD